MNEEAKGKGFHRNEMACPLTYDILKGNAKANRLSMTEAEKVLWNILKDRSNGICFRRQHIIGDYIVDFICLKSKLIIEVDGGYHFTPQQQAEDETRTIYLQSQGFQVLRFTNEEVLFDINQVIETIKANL